MKIYIRPVITEKGLFQTGYYEDEGAILCKPSHWMPLPYPPKNNLHRTSKQEIIWKIF